MSWNAESVNAWTPSAPLAAPSCFTSSCSLTVRQLPSDRLAVGVVGSVAVLILGLACIGYGVFQLVAPRREARFAIRYNRWWYARIPWFYSLPIMKKL